MAYQWRFFRAGGVDQVQLRTGSDLVHLEELDQKLWVALACPVKGTEFNRRTLELIDGDGDGRVRASELIAATRWVRERLSDIELLARPGDAVPLSALRADTPDGAHLVATMKRLLESLGKSELTALSFADMSEALGKFAGERFNGDDVIAPASAVDEDIAALIKDIIACTEAPAMDRSGVSGVRRADVEAFFEAVAANAAWREAGKGEGVLPLGDATAAAFDAYEAVRCKVDDYFGRVRVAAYDARALEAVNREQSEYLAIAAKDLHISADEVRHFPIARVSGDQPLPLVEGVNPAWLDAVTALRDKVVRPLIGDRKTLTTTDWAKIQGTFAAHRAWREAKAGIAVDSLGPERVAQLLESRWRSAVEALLALEDAAKPLADAILDVERLCHYRRDLLDLGNNFVAFKHFYGRKQLAMFQIGRLYLDRRSCDLCIEVNDAGRHATMAPHSNFFVLYCDLRNAKGQTRTIAAAVTDGDVDNLMVGRNGIFYDRDGNDWDAVITRIVENPISIRQAFWRPYKKALRFIEEQMSKRAQAAQDKSDAQVAAASSKADSAVDGKVESPAANEPPRKIDIGVVAAIGVAVGGITAALGILMQSFFGLGIWMPLGLLALMLLISGPSMAIAWLKLRRRNLGPLLDANGWAVGAMAKVNVRLGASLTDLAALPPGAERDLADPFADKKRPWWLYLSLMVLIIVGALWFFGSLDSCLPNGVRSTSVLGEHAPAAQIETPEAPPAEPEVPEAEG